MTRTYQLILTLVCLGFAGCSGAGNDQPELGQVTGTVLFEGSPLAGAVVTFMPEAGRPASGTTNDQGVYELTYIRDTKGCKIGPNKVAITSGAEGEDEMEQEGDDADQSQIDRVGITIPAHYNDKTELTADVKKGENTFNFDLKKSRKT